MERDIILEKVREADMVLVGLGEDFNLSLIHISEPTRPY